MSDGVEFNDLYWGSREVCIAAPDYLRSALKYHVVAVTNCFCFAAIFFRKTDAEDKLVVIFSSVFTVSSVERSSTKSTSVSKSRAESSPKACLEHSD